LHAVATVGPISASINARALRHYSEDNI